MRRAVTLPFLGLAFFLFLWINLPKSLADRMRSAAVAPFALAAPEPRSNEWARLQLENQTLRTQIEQAYEWLSFQQGVGEQFQVLKNFSEFSQRRAAHLRDLLFAQTASVPAQIVYRDPSSWSSSLWVNVGEANNRALGRTLIAKNSPVLSDGALDGVVDYVGKWQARIRLITDSGLSPSVRVCRGGSQQRELARQIESLLRSLEKREDALPLVSSLKAFQAQLGTQWEDGYLAKGELHGSSAPFWRSRSPILRGIGFNFDYADKEGSPKDLKPGVPILKEGDLLVTSGLDGVFPAGLRVGSVLRVYPQKEGGYSYEIDVRPSASHLNDLQTVFILPALSE